MLPKVRRWYVWACGIFVGLATFPYGYDTAINGVKDMVGFREIFNLSLPSDDSVNESLNGSTDVEEVYTNTILGTLVSVFAAGALVGALVGGPISDAAGRKKAMIIGLAIYAVGGTMQTAAFFLWMMFLGRILTGIGVGIVHPTLAVFIAELSPKDIRGKLVASSGSFASAAILIAAAINTVLVRFIPHDGWRISLAVQPAVGVIIIIGMFFVPESPRWLTKKGKDEKALAVLKRIHRQDEKACAELKEIEDTIIDTSFKELLQLLCNFKMIKRVLLGFSLFFISRWCGITAVKYYSVTIFNKVGIEGFLASLLVSVSFLCGNIVTTFLVDKLGRKVILLLGIICMFLSTSTAAIFIQTLGDIKAVGYIIVVLIGIFSVSFVASLGTIPYIINSEIFPLKLRGVMYGLSNMAWWIGNIMFAQLTPVLLSSSLQTHGTFYLFAGAQIVAFFYVLLLIPETKGQSLEKMDVIFSKPWLERVNIFYYLRCGCLFEYCKRSRGGYSVASSTDTAQLKEGEEEEEVELQTEPIAPAIDSSDTDKLLHSAV